tara:strand:- start:593 stop:721 length:129 start_codon:yes stop_codon:yes gene_type:complete
MKKIYLIVLVCIVLFLAIFGISFIEIPVPSKSISEDYKLEIQ